MISAVGLAKSYGRVAAVRGIDLEVARGRVLALLGPNGAGKTTTVRMLCTLLKPDGGRVLIGGFDVVREPRKVRGVIGPAGQSASVDEKLTGLQNLAMLGRLHRLGRRTAGARARQLVERFGLAEAAARPVRTYSGGMRRKLDLAASLITAAPVLFLDEPTAGLDPVSRTALWEIVGDLVRGGTTVLLTTQYLEEADRLADRVAVIDRGRVVADTTAQQLKSRNGGTGLEIAAATGADFERLRALYPDRVAGGEPAARTVVFRVRDTGADGLRDLHGLLATVLEAGVAIENYTIRRPTLDEAFLQLVGRTTIDSESGES
jgi:ABC-2 type transport system ATP-binding protein